MTAVRGMVNREMKIGLTGIKAITLEKTGKNSIGQFKQRDLIMKPTIALDLQCQRLLHQ